MYGEIVHRVIKNRGYSFSQIGRMSSVSDVVVGKLVKEKKITTKILFKILGSLDLTFEEENEIIENYFFDNYGKRLTLKK